MNRKSIDKKQSKSSTFWKKFEKLISCNFFTDPFQDFVSEIIEDEGTTAINTGLDENSSLSEKEITSDTITTATSITSPTTTTSTTTSTQIRSYSLKLTHIYSNLLKFFLGHPTTLPRSCPAPDITYNGSLLTTNEAFKDIHDVEFEVKTGPFPGDRRRCKLSCVAGQWVGPLCRKNEGMLHINKNI